MTTDPNVRRYRQFYDHKLDAEFTRWPHALIALTASGAALGSECHMTLRSVYTTKRGTDLVINALKTMGIEVELEEANHKSNTRISNMMHYHPSLLTAELELGASYKMINPETGKLEDETYIITGISDLSKRYDGYVTFVPARDLAEAYDVDRQTFVKDIKQFRAVAHHTRHLFNHTLPVKILEQPNAFLNDFFDKNDRKHNPFRLVEQMLNYEANSRNQLIVQAARKHLQEEEKDRTSTSSRPSGGMSMR